MPNTNMWALYAREVKRFQKLWLDTVFSPIVSVGLYLAIFGIVVGDRAIGGVNYVFFVYSGLLAMLVVNSSFANPAFALIIAKNVGSLMDLQLAPIKPWGIGIAYALAAVTRSIATLFVALLATAWFIPGISVHHPLLAIAALLVTGLQFGMLGVIFGMWAKNFEALTFITTFIMQPMIFLAGVFYPVSDLPAPWNVISQFNPLHHNINLFRYALTGYSDMSAATSLLTMATISVVLFFIMQQQTRKAIRSA